MRAAAISAGSLDSEDWNAWALPWKVPFTDGGMPISVAAFVMASTASPSATPGCRLKLSVTAGNWPWCATESGPTLPVSTYQRGQRHGGAGQRRFHVEPVERGK